MGNFSIQQSIGEQTHCKIIWPDLSGGFLSGLIRIDATNSAGSFDDSTTCMFEEAEKSNVTINLMNCVPNLIGAKMNVSKRNFTPKTLAKTGP